MKIPFTPERIVIACNKYGVDPHNCLCSYLNHYKKTPKLLIQLGGRSKGNFFWPPPIFSYARGDHKPSKQRAMMLAFLLTWSQDPDFEV